MAIPRLCDDVVVVYDVQLCELVQLVPHLLRVAAKLSLKGGQGAGANDIGSFKRPAPEDRRLVRDGRIALRTECFRPKCPLPRPGLDYLFH